MTKKHNFSVDKKDYESPYIEITDIDEDVVTASLPYDDSLGWGEDWDDSRDDTIIGGN